VRDRRDAELIQEIRDLCESNTACSKGIVFGIGRGLGSRPRFSRSPVDRSSEGDDQFTCQCIVIRASCIVRIDITSKLAFFFSSECSRSKSSYGCSSEAQSPVIRAVEVTKHSHENSDIVISRVVIIPAEKGDRICDTGPRNALRVCKASDH
jgi:hypothetical protein